MKTVIYNRYGSSKVLNLVEMEKPKPAKGEVLVRIMTSSVNPLEWRSMRANPFLMRIETGVFRPRNNRLGADLAGMVESIGEDVENLKVGDRVFGEIYHHGFCAYSEYAAVPENALVKMPPGISFEQAASIPVAGVTAVQCLRDQGKIKSGQDVLINGASGGVGTFAVQMAKYFGANVTGVCSTRNVEMVRSLGADKVVDYTEDDFTDTDQDYDLILDNVGNRRLKDMQSILKVGGTYLFNGFSIPMVWQLFSGGMSRAKKEGKVMTMAEETSPSMEDLELLIDLMNQGKINAVIDRTYPLSDISDAVAYVETKHARAKVIISMDNIHMENN